MGKYFMCNTPVANLERMMALPAEAAGRARDQSSQSGMGMPLAVKTVSSN